MAGFTADSSGVPAGIAFPVFSNSGTTYTAPLTQGSLVLGTFAPGQSFTVNYLANTSAESDGGTGGIGSIHTEDIEARFGDPLNSPGEAAGQLTLQQQELNVPEPSTLLLLLVGGLGLVCRRRR